MRTTDLERTVNKLVGEDIKKHRTERHISLRKLGAMVGVTGQAIKYYEDGRTAITLQKFVQIMTVLGQDPSQFVNNYYIQE